MSGRNEEQMGICTKQYDKKERCGGHWCIFFQPIR